jgi:hypothetical protein
MISGMCMMCDGHSHDDWLFSMDALIHRFGWALLGVEAEPDSVGWDYTMGLVDRFDHPELVIVGTHDPGRRWLNELGARIERGERFTAGSTVELDGFTCELVEVDPEQFHTARTFNGWMSYYLSKGVLPSPMALQIIPPPCPDHGPGAAQQLRLDTQVDVLARAGLFPHGPNRAARRAMARKTAAARRRRTNRAP